MVNKVILIGNVGQAPETFTTESGKTFAKFSLATSESWKDKQGQKQTKTEWHNLVCFSEGLVRVISTYVGKGDKLYIEGKITTRKWQDKEGNNRYTTEILIGSLLMLGSTAGNAAEPEPDTTEQEQEETNDLPF